MKLPIQLVARGANVRAVSRVLTSKYGYRVVESEWITVFDYQE